MLCKGFTISGRTLKLPHSVEETGFKIFLDVLRKKQAVELEHDSVSRLDYPTSYFLLLVKQMTYLKIWFCHCHMVPDQQKIKDIPENLVKGNHIAVKLRFISLHNRKHNSLS